MVAQTNISIDLLEGDLWANLVTPGKIQENMNKTVRDTGKRSSVNENTEKPAKKSLNTAVL